MRVADPRGVRHAERVLGRRSVHDRLLRAEPRQLQTSVDPPELGHHRVDHARGPAAGVVLTDRRQVGRHVAVLRAADPRAHRHPVGPKRSDVRGTFCARFPLLPFRTTNMRETLVSNWFGENYKIQLLLHTIGRGVYALGV